MNTKIIATERERLATRRDIKRQLAEASALHARLKAMLGQKRALADKREEAADRHSETTAPIQKRLAEIAVVNSESLLAGKDLDPRLLREEADLIRQRDEANVLLEREIAAINRTAKSMVAEIELVRHQCSGLDALQSRLKQPGIANPELLRELAVAMTTLRWAADRRAAAEIAKSKIEDVRRDFSRKVEGRKLTSEEDRDAADYDGRWQAALDEFVAASEIEEAAAADVKRIRQAIIDE